MRVEMHDELQWEAALKTVCDSKWNSECFNGYE